MSSSYYDTTRTPLGEKHGGWLLTQLMAGVGIRHIFGQPGGQAMLMYDAIYHLEPPTVQHIVVRDERNGGYAAVAYAKASNRVGVCDATVGPGAVLFTSAFAEALNGSTPLLGIISDVDQGWANLVDHGSASQAVDQMGMLRPLAKWVAKVSRVESLPDLFRQALRHATTGRPGPAALFIPEDVFRADASRVAIGPLSPEMSELSPGRVVPNSASIEAATEALLSARRPLLVVGGGGMLSGAWDAIAMLVDRLQLPIATTFTGKGIVPETHALALGVLGYSGTRAARDAARVADLIFYVGAKGSENSTFGWKVPALTQRVIHLDLDPTEIGRIFPTEVGLVGDARLGLEALNQAIAQRHPGDCRWPDWTRQVAQWRTDWLAYSQQRANTPSVPIDPHQVVAELQRLLGPRDTLVCDAGFASGWGGVHFRQACVGRQVILPRGLAGLGTGIPGALGARLARPEGEVICLTGDGGAGYALGELSTFTRFKQKVIVVVLNNSALGWIKWGQRMRYNDAYQSSDFATVDYDVCAQGMGWAGLRVTSPGELRPALEAAVAETRAVLVDVRSSVWDSPVPAHTDWLAGQAASLKQKAA